MGKKKKHEKNNKLHLKKFDESLNYYYENLVEEIEAYQQAMYEADRKAMKKKKKNLKKNPNYIYRSNKQKNVRKSIVKDMKKSGFLKEIEKVLNEIGPMIVCIARLVATLILSIFRIDSIKDSMSEKTIDRLSTIYNLAMSIG